MKIYLAGPDVFNLFATEIGNEKKTICRSFGFEPLYPLDNEIEFTNDKFKDGKIIVDANIEMIKQCNIVLANLIPFRGPSADIGTVWECAYGKALGKIIISYNVPSQYYKERVEKDEFLIEDFEGFDNIMLVHNVDLAIKFSDFTLVMYQVQSFLKDKKKGLNESLFRYC